MADIKRCDLCQSMINREDKICDHSKNGYCQVYRFSCEDHAEEYNMHPSIHTKNKKIIMPAVDW
jgi:hypothetical protein